MSLPQGVPTGTVQLDRPRTIAFTLGALRRLREATGKSIEQALSDDALMENVGPVVWALLTKEDREGLTVADVEDMIGPNMLGDIMTSITSLAAPSVDTSEGKAEAATAAQ